MKTIEFFKTNGKIGDVGALHSWLDRNIKWITNGSYTLLIKRRVKSRSLNQNRLMWLWFACIAKETGETAQRIHDVYCYMFLPEQVTDFETGQLVRVPGHTHALTSEAFTDFLNRVQANAAEMGIILPNPDDLAWAEFEEEYKRYLND